MLYWSFGGLATCCSRIITKATIHCSRGAKSASVFASCIDHAPACVHACSNIHSTQGVNDTKIDTNKIFRTTSCETKQPYTQHGDNHCIYSEDTPYIHYIRRTTLNKDVARYRSKNVHLCMNNRNFDF